VGFDQAAGDRETQSGAAGSAVARCLQPTERLEHGLPLRGRDTCAFVVDRQQDVVVDDHTAKMRATAVFDGIVRQIGHHASECETIAENDWDLFPATRSIIDARAA